MSKESVEFHIKNDDYFGTLATVISLIRQNLESNGLSKNNKSLVDLENNLVFMQSNYKIIKK
ncbi:MAG: hypothetical protein PHE07_08640 [Bacteroidales bacterium]|nr:hypothetical protein [Bacteroidales bacterium]